MSKLQAIFTIFMTAAGIVGGVWFGFALAGWLGAMLLFPFGGGLGYIIGAHPANLIEFLNF